MAFTLDLYKAGDPTPSAVYTFEFTPMVSIGYFNNYNESGSTAVITSYREEWKITQAAFLNVDPAALATAWEALITFISSNSDGVVGVRIKSGSTALHTMSTSTHRKLKITDIQMQESPGSNVNHILFNFTISGTKHITLTATNEDGETATVSKLEQKLSFQYDEGGFLTKTLSGVVRTNGSGAEEAARTVGRLALPSAYFAYITNGPEGVDVVVNSQPADDEATFTCSVREQALAFPSSSVYKYTKSETLKPTRFADYLETTVMVQAASMELAESTALSNRPQNCEGESRVKVIDTNTISVQFYSKTQKKSFLSKRYEFTISGGGRSTVVQPTLYGEPVIGKGQKQPVVIEESITVRAYKDSPALFHSERTFKETDLDTSSPVFTIRQAKESDSDAALDEYESVLRNRYVFAEGSGQSGFRQAALTAFNSVG